MGVTAKPVRCSFERCPLKHVKTMAEVFADFKEVVLAVPAPTPKKKT